ncbi:hypothetical protein KDL45_06770 [bacterium]|nr:hypothetical protein [bacterium]
MHAPSAAKDDHPVRPPVRRPIEDPTRRVFRYALLILICAALALAVVVGVSYADEVTLRRAKNPIQFENTSNNDVLAWESPARGELPDRDDDEIFARFLKFGEQAEQ